MRIRSGIVWFDDDDYIGSTVQFPLRSATWKLERKLQENEIHIHESEGMDGYGPEARAVYVCSKLNGHGPEEAVVKIRKQIPWMGTASKKPSVRAEQATSKMIAPSEMELKALKILRYFASPYTATMLSSMKREQGKDEWVPGGYILYILMEKLPGICPELSFHQMSRQERDDLRAGFKAAYLDCIACGIQHGDPGLRNLIWDNATKTCYIIDFEIYHEPERRAWWNITYVEWNLARVDYKIAGDDYDYVDMSKMIL